MDRLSRYIARQFTIQALTIFLAGGVLIWLMQLLRLFDIVSAQGQNILTLMGQSALTTPTYARSILYVCLAIGLVRGLRALQQSRELHTIHATRRTRALWTGIACYTLAGVMLVGAIAHWIEPRARAVSADWSAQIAADIVGRALTPGRFTTITGGIVASARGRDSDGALRGFFLDDSTNPTRRTYFADQARVFQDENGYQLILNDGAVQYESPGRQGLSQIAFMQYHISMASLVEADTPTAGLDQADTLRLLEGLRAQDYANPDTVRALIHGRNGDMLRALNFAILVVALLAFPSGQRVGRQVPMELVVLFIAFGEQAFTSFLGGGLLHYLSPLAILAAALALFARKLARARVGIWRRHGAEDTA